MARRNCAPLTPNWRRFKKDYDGARRTNRNGEFPKLISKNAKKTWQSFSMAEDRNRLFSVTLNNITSDQLTTFQGLTGLPGSRFTWTFGQHEMGASGTQHLQACVRIKNALTVKSLARLLRKSGLPGCHIEVCLGSPEQNKVYCSKPEGRLSGPWEGGTMPQPGVRNDLIRMVALARAGATNRALWDANPVSMLRYGRSFMQARRDSCLPRSEPTLNTVLWGGTTGRGKTWRAIWMAKQLYPDEEPCIMVVPEPGRQTWFDGYEGEKVVIFDDMVPDAMSWALFLRLSDRYPLRVQIKGGTVMWAPKLIIWTSNVSPARWFPGKEGKLGPLVRRLSTRGSEIIHMTANWTPPDYTPSDEMIETASSRIAEALEVDPGSTVETDSGEEQGSTTEEDYVGNGNTG